MLDPNQMAAVRNLTLRHPYKPEGFLAFERSHQSMELMFEGLKIHYMEAIASGRGEIWAAAAHGIIDLLASGPLAIDVEVEAKTN